MKPLCVVSCPIDTFSGYGARSRYFVRALIKVRNDWDIKILPQKWGDTPWNFLSEDDPLKKLFIPTLEFQPDVWFQITVPNEFQPVGKSFSVGVSAGIETTVFPGEFLEGMNKMNLNLVSSNHSRNVAMATSFEKKDSKTNQTVSNIKLEKPCEVLFEGLDLNTYYKKPTSSKTNILKDVSEEFCFLYTGHWLPGNFGEDRKNTAELIRTFLKTFNTPSNKKPALVLKTNRVDYSLLDRESVLKDINRLRESYGGKNAPNIYLLHGEMTDNELNLLNNDPKVKAFLSFTKGEGFGRPLMEQAITGKPMITTNWSGHTDFLKPDYNCLIGGQLKPVHESAANQFLLKDSQWFNIDVEVASKAMKDVFKHYKKYLEGSRKQTQYLKDNWSLDKMAEKLDKLLPEVKPAPKHQALKLPKLKKVGKKDELPKLKLPKLKKVNV